MHRNWRRIIQINRVIEMSQRYVIGQRVRVIVRVSIHGIDGRRMRGPFVSGQGVRVLPVLQSVDDIVTDGW